MADKIEIIIDAKDEAKGAFASVGNGIKTLIGAAAGVMAAKVGFDALKEGILGSVEAANESANVAAQTEAVLKSTGGAAGVTGDQIGDLATKLSQITPIDDEVVQSTENLLLTFTSIGKDIFPDVTKTALDMSVALGTDTKSAATMLGKALQDPTQGLTALTRVGVNFTDQQKAQIKAMQEAGNVAGAQKVILAELQREYGGSAEAAGKTFGGQLTILKTQLGNVQEQIGGFMVPILMQLTGILSSNLPIVLGALGVVAAAAFTLWAISAGIAAAATIAAVAPVVVAMAPVLAVVAGIAAAIGLLFVAWQTNFLGIQGIVASAWAAIGPVFDAIGTRLSDFAATVLPQLLAAWSNIQAGISAVVGVIQAVVMAVFGAIAGFLSDHGAQIQAILSAAWSAIQTVIDSALSIISNLIQLVLNVISGNWSGAWQNIQNIVQAVWDAIQTVVSSALTILQNAIQIGLDAVGIAFHAAWDALPGVVSGAWGLVQGAVSAGISAIQGMFSGAASWLYQAGRDIVMGLVNGLGSLLGAVQEKAAEIANAAKNAVTGALGIHSPSTVMDQYGRFIGQGLVQGMAALQPSVTLQAAQLAGGVTRGTGAGIGPRGMAASAPRFPSSFTAALPIQVNVDGTPLYNKVATQQFRAMQAGVSLAGER